MARVIGDNDGARRIARIDEHVVATDDSINLKPGARQDLDDLSRANAREPTATHQAAMVISRISGLASDGMGMPWSRRYARTARIASSAEARASSRVAFGDDLWKGGDQDRESTIFLRLEHD